MARPKHDDPSLFTGGEVTEATGMTARKLQHLRESHLGPFAKRDQDGGKYGEDTLAELAMIAACEGTGYQATVAAGLVSAFLAQHDGHPAARFCGLDQLYDVEAPEDERNMRYRPKIYYEGETWFHRYTILHRRDPWGEMRLTSASGQDAVLVVADRHHVGERTKGKPRLRTVVDEGVNPEGPFLLGRIENLVAGQEPKFTSVDYLASGGEGRDRDLMLGFQRSVADALAVVEVNLSLAIRRAFDRVYQMRRRKGGPLWPEVAA